MNGLYILTTSQLTKDNTIKFGMSTRIEYRWIDYHYFNYKFKVF